MNLRTYLVCRIIFTTLFLVFSTVLWFTRKVEVYHFVETKVQSNEVVFAGLSKISEKENQVYRLKLENKDDIEQKVKVYIIPDILQNNINNNYIKYQINNKEIKTLNMDGMILVDKMAGLEEKEIELKIWVSDTYTGNLSYSGRVVIV